MGFANRHDKVCKQICKCLTKLPLRCEHGDQRVEVNFTNFIVLNEIKKYRNTKFQFLKMNTEI